MVEFYSRSIVLHLAARCASGRVRFRREICALDFSCQ
jgi:hypothetical protein